MSESTEDPIRVTISGRPPDPACANTGAPQPINPATGMHGDYWILSEAERKKGFVRPVRQSYKHVGVRPKHPLRDLTEEEHKEYDKYSYVKYESYELDEAGLTGRFWTQAQLDSGCGSVTSMSLPLAETYARDPKFYGATFCATCRVHRPVEEFVWLNDVLGPANEVVGS